MEQQVMPRHTQPIEVAAAKGAIRKHPERYRNTPPLVRLELGTAPDRMTEAEKGYWFEIETYAPVNVLRGADRLMLELAAGYLAERAENPKAFSAAKMGQLIGLLGRLGMSPADRQKLGTEKPKDDDFREFE